MGLVDFIGTEPLAQDLFDLLCVVAGFLIESFWLLDGILAGLFCCFLEPFKAFCLIGALLHRGSYSRFYTWMGGVLSWRLSPDQENVPEAVYKRGRTAKCPTSCFLFLVLAMSLCHYRHFCFAKVDKSYDST